MHPYPLSVIYSPSTLPENKCYYRWYAQVSAGALQIW